MENATYQLPDIPLSKEGNSSLIYDYIAIGVLLATPTLFALMYCGVYTYFELKKLIQRR